MSELQIDKTARRFAWAIGVAAVVFFAISFGFLYFLVHHARGQISENAEVARSLQTWLAAQLITMTGFVIASVGVFFGFANTLVAREAGELARQASKARDEANVRLNEIKGVVADLGLGERIIREVQREIGLSTIRRKASDALFEIMAARMRQRVGEAALRLDRLEDDEILRAMNRFGSEREWDKSAALLSLFTYLPSDRVGRVVRTFLGDLLDAGYFEKEDPLHMQLRSALGID